MRVVHFQRRPVDSHVSIERLFAEVRRHLPAHVDCVPHTCPHFSRGLLPRIANVRDAARHQGDVNHIVGDVHYLAIGLPTSRTVLTIHDCATLDRLRGLKRAVFKWFWFDLPIRRSAIVTTVSEAARREIVKHVRCDPSRIHVIHNCAVAECRPHAKPFNKPMPTILQVGTGYNKNLDRVITALEGISCNLHIIGQLLPEHRGLLERHGVRFTNTPRANDAEMSAAYRDCDLLVFASTYEGFGLPIVEANAVGRPVITSNLLSMPEVAGDAALLVDPLDAGAIRMAVLRVIEGAALRERLVAAGFENVKRFQPATAALSYANLYRELFA